MAHEIPQERKKKGEMKKAEKRVEMKIPVAKPNRYNNRR